MAMTLSHDQAQSMIRRSLDAAAKEQFRLDEIEQRALDAHLQGCEQCAAYQDEMRALDRRLSRSLADRYPARAYSPARLAAARASIQAKMRRESMSKTIGSAARLAGAGIVLILIVGALYWLMNGVGPRQPIPGGGLTATPYRAAETVGPRVTPTPTPYLPTEAPDATRTPPVGAVTPLAEHAGRWTLEEAQVQVSHFIFSTQPDMNPAAQFPLDEITTPEIWNALGAQLFKVTGELWHNEAFLLKEGRVAHVGSAFGGEGLAQFFVSDLNGTIALVYLDRFGSGRAIQKVGAVWIDGVAFRSDEMEVNDGALLQATDEVEYVPSDAAQQPERTVLKLVDGMLALAPKDSKLALFADAALGVWLWYPADWEQNGEKGFAANNQSEFHGWFNLAGPFDGSPTQACEYAATEQTGNTPATPLFLRLAYVGAVQVCFTSDDPATNAPRPGSGSTYYFPLPSGDQYGILTVSATYSIDPSTNQLIAGPGGRFDYLFSTLRFHDSQQAVANPPVVMEPAGPASPDLTSTSADGLKLDEWKLVSAAIDTPGHLEFASRLPLELYDRNVDLKGAWSVKAHQDANALLQLFGYSLSYNTDRGAFELDKQLADGKAQFISPEVTDDPYLSAVFPPAGYQDGAGPGNFAMVIENAAGDWLVTKDSIEKYDMYLHCNTRPVYAGAGRLITAECDHGKSPDEAETVRVKLDGKTIYTYVAVQEPTSEAVKGLFAYGGHWALEVHGTLMIDGVIWNRQGQPAAEIFNFAVINGKPFYFFKQAGKIHLSYDGQALPVAYDEVPHGACCEPAAFNPGANAYMAWFYAKKEGYWYYVEAAME